MTQVSREPAVAIVLGRAGSKGLPGKNRALVAGRPCVMWTVDHVLAAGGIGRAGVSTDDAELARLGIEAGLEHWPRSAALAGDTATIDDAAREALREADRRAVVAAHTAVVLLYANVPVRPAGLIDRALARFHETGCDSVQSYADVGKHHPTWTTRIGPDGRVGPWEGQTRFGGVYRRQDLEPAFIPDGGVIVVRRACLDAAEGLTGQPHAFLGEDHRGITTRAGEVVDIDNAVDLAVADQLLRQGSQVANAT